MKRLMNITVKVLASIAIFSVLSIRVSYTCSQAPDTYRPIYMSFDELRSSIKSLPTEPLKDPGKILVKGDLVFVNERYKGVHIIDNSDPRSPQNVAFIRVPGNIDIAMKGDTLYADSFVDLVALDVSNPADVFVTQRLENIYPNQPFVEEFTYWSKEIDLSQGVVIGRELVKSKTGGCGGESNGWGLMGCGRGSGSGDSVAPFIADDSAGVNGSLARITIVDDHLYLLAGSNLKTISIADQEHPVYINSIELSWDIETLYPYEDALFVGGQTGVQIIDISYPDDPTPISTFQHPWQCDPIVVSGEIAYVTLRAGARCWGGNNRLDILDVTELSNPVLIKAYPLDNPYGLAIDGNILFVADGLSGVRVFDTKDPLNLTEIAYFPGKVAQDIILYQHRAHIIGQNGLYQYDYSTVDNIKFLSHVPVVH